MSAWISPSAAMDMVYDVRAEGCEDIGFALLRPKSKGEKRTVAELVGAKLAPVRPTAAAAGAGMAITARDHRLILAPKVGDPGSIQNLVQGYDASTKSPQRVLAAVLTIKFDPDISLHDSFDRVCVFATFRLARERRLSSIAVLHTPGEEGFPARAHAHLCILARRHFASGWADIDTDLNDTAHPVWAGEWRAFCKAWEQTLPPGRA